MHVRTTIHGVGSFVLGGTKTIAYQGSTRMLLATRRLKRLSLPNKLSPAKFRRGSNSTLHHDAGGRKGGKPRFSTLPSPYGGPQDYWQIIGAVEKSIQYGDLSFGSCLFRGPLVTLPPIPCATTCFSTRGGSPHSPQLPVATQQSTFYLYNRLIIISR